MIRHVVKCALTWVNHRVGSAGQKGGNLTVMVANIVALSAVVGVSEAIVDPDVALSLPEVARDVVSDLPDVKRGAVLPPVAISRRTSRVTSCCVANSTNFKKMAT